MNFLDIQKSINEITKELFNKRNQTIDTFIKTWLVAYPRPEGLSDLEWVRLVITNYDLQEKSDLKNGTVTWSLVRKK